MTLAHGADLRSLNRYQGTALIPAAERGHVEAVRLLIQAGVEVNHVNRLGWTALIEAVVLGQGGERHQQVVQALVDARADVNLPDAQGRTPLALAQAHGYPEIARILRRAGAH
jgi:ankyrin repeat protein